MYNCEKSLVSVIIPVYNVEKYLDKCIESILRQSYVNFEILLIDDGSSDRSCEICDKWKAQDKRIIVFHQKNKGVSNARNVGLSNMKGEYFTCVDPDDYLNENYILELVHMQKVSSADIVFCGLIEVNENGSRIGCLSRKKEIISGKNVDEVVWGKRGYCIGGVCKLIRSSIVKRNSIQYIPNLKNGEDWLFLRDCLRFVKKISSVGQNLYYYVHRENSASSNFTNGFSTSLLQLWKYISCEKQKEIYSPWCDKKIEIAVDILINAHVFKFFLFEEYDELVDYVRNKRNQFLCNSKMSFYAKSKILFKLYFYKQFAFFKWLLKK